jgi:hypothetical protein
MEVSQALESFLKYSWPLKSSFLARIATDGPWRLVLMFGEKHGTGGGGGGSSQPDL